MAKLSILLANLTQYVLSFLGYSLILFTGGTFRDHNEGVHADQGWTSIFHQDLEGLYLGFVV